MRLEVVDNHSVAADLLPPRARILDVGCRGFRFAVHFARLGHFVTCLDPAEDVIPSREMLDAPSLWTFHRAALVGPGHPRSGYLRLTDDPEARHVTREKVHAGDWRVRCITLDELSDSSGWDLIKLNCEGAEADILLGMTRPMASQIVVSFHEHTPQAIGDAGVQRVIDHVSQWYEVHNHVKESRYGCSPNWWDTVLVKRGNVECGPS